MCPHGWRFGVQTVLMDTTRVSPAETVGAVVTSQPEQKIRDSIEALLVEFRNAQATGIVADEIWNRIVGPAFDKLNLEIQGYQVNSGYEKGWEHGAAAGRAWKRERDDLRARICEATKVAEEMLRQLVSGPERRDAEAIHAALQGEQSEQV